MSLSCDCDIDWYPDPGDVIGYPPDEYTILDTPRRKRCMSCKELIALGSQVGRFEHYKIPEGDIEERIYGDDGEVPRAPRYMCEACMDIYFSLTELGYCISDNNMRAALTEYQTLKKTGLPL